MIPSTDADHALYQATLLAEDQHPAAGVLEPGSASPSASLPNQGGASPPASPPTADSCTFPASAERVGRSAAEAVAPVPTASGAGAALGLEDLEPLRTQLDDPVLAMALRRIELLELAIARAVALLPRGVLRTRLVELIPGVRIPSSREVLMPEWRRRRCSSVRAGELARELVIARRHALLGAEGAAVAESIESSIGLQ